MRQFIPDILLNIISPIFSNYFDNFADSAANVVVPKQSMAGHIINLGHTCICIWSSENTFYKTFGTN